MLCSDSVKLSLHVFFQSLTLLHYLLKNGSERVISNARDHLFEMRSLESYKYIDEKGKDQGLNGSSCFCYFFKSLKPSKNIPRLRKLIHLEFFERI